MGVAAARRLAKDGMRVAILSSSGKGEAVKSPNRRNVDDDATLLLCMIGVTSRVGRTALRKYASAVDQDIDPPPFFDNGIDQFLEVLIGLFDQ